MFAALLIGPCLGWCMAETATFVYNNGKVEFGDFKKISGDSVYVETVDNGGAHKSFAIAKSSLSEVVFDSGEKLNLALAEYPPSSASSSPSSTAAAAVAKQQTAALTATAVPTMALPPSNALPSTIRNPFTYGGLSAIVPGLGQALQGDYAKGAVCFALVGLTVGGSLAAWNSTTTAYNNLQQTKSAEGLYNNSDYQSFTVRLHGSEILTCVSAVLYLLNIADATADAVIFNKRQNSPKLSLTISPSGIGCGLACAF